MNNAVYNFPLPQNEPVLDYLKGSAERAGQSKNTYQSEAGTGL